MKEMIQKLAGSFYFDSAEFPFSIRHVEGRSVSHACDFTGIIHSHDFIEIVIICEGVGEQIVDGALRALRRLAPCGSKALRARIALASLDRLVLL